MGDGNFHFGCLVDPSLPDELVRAEQFNQRLVERAIRLGSRAAIRTSISRLSTGQASSSRAEMVDALELDLGIDLLRHQHQHQHQQQQQQQQQQQRFCASILPTT